MTLRERIRAGQYDGAPKDFRRDLFRSLDIADHPKADKLYELAWEEGHSSGYEEVLNYAEDFVELLR